MRLQRDHGQGSWHDPEVAQELGAIEKSLHHQIAHHFGPWWIQDLAESAKVFPRHVSSGMCNIKSDNVGPVLVVRRADVGISGKWTDSNRVAINDNLVYWKSTINDRNTTNAGRENSRKNWDECWRNDRLQRERKSCWWWSYCWQLRILFVRRLKKR